VLICKYSEKSRKKWSENFGEKKAFRYSHEQEKRKTVATCKVYKKEKKKEGKKESKLAKKLINV